ncbi:MAG: RNA polymerase sigma factor [Myxococcota bacterium]
MAFQRGNEEAFVTLYRRYRDRIFNFARRLLGDVARAEEAAQDVFLKVYGARKSYTVRSRFSSYIFRIARNHCFNIRARHEHKLVDRGREVERHANGAASPEANVERQNELEAVRIALATLPEKQAAAFILAHYEGMSYREIANALDVSEGATKSLIHRARDRLVHELGKSTHREPEVIHAV